jgi:hypothetical protein
LSRFRRLTRDFARPELTRCGRGRLAVAVPGDDLPEVELTGYERLLRSEISLGDARDGRTFGTGLTVGPETDVLFGQTHKEMARRDERAGRQATGPATVVFTAYSPNGDTDIHEERVPVLTPEMVIVDIHDEEVIRIEAESLADICVHEVCFECQTLPDADDCV